MATDEDAPGSLPGNFASFFDTSTFADCVVQIDRKEFKLHKVVLSAHSEYFKNAFNGNWKESSGTMTLKGDAEYAVAAMLKFMYTSDYDSSGRDENSSSPMVFDVEVYQTADKYLVPALKSLAKHNCQEAFGACWDTDDFPDAIAQVYSLPDTSDQGLRAMVIEVVLRHSKQLILKPKFCDILKGTTEFASDLATCMITKSERDLVKNRCSRCTQTFEATPPKRESYYCIYCGGDLARWQR